VRRLTYILLGILLLEMSGLRELCFAQPRPSHHCCPAPRGESLPNPSSVPDCCLSMVLTLEASVAEVTSATNHTLIVKRTETRSVTEPALPRAERVPEIVTFSGLTLPPLTPLRQTCLLLI